MTTKFRIDEWFIFGKLLILIRRGNGVRFLDTLLHCELNFFSHRITWISTLLTAFFMSGLTVIFLNLEYKEPICILAGFLLFWERFVLLKLYEERLKRND